MDVHLGKQRGGKVMVCGMYGMLWYVMGCLVTLPRDLLSSDWLTRGMGQKLTNPLSGSSDWAWLVASATYIRYSTGTHRSRVGKSVMGDDQDSRVMCFVGERRQQAKAKVGKLSPDQANQPGRCNHHLHQTQHKHQHRHRHHHHNDGTRAVVRFAHTSTSIWSRRWSRVQTDVRALLSYFPGSALLERGMRSADVSAVLAVFLAVSPGLLCVSL